jgi:hypothetical protein
MSSTEATGLFSGRMGECSTFEGGDEGRRSTMLFPAVAPKFVGGNPLKVMAQAIGPQIQLVWRRKKAGGKGVEGI